MKANEVIRELAEALADERRTRKQFSRHSAEMAKEVQVLENKVQWIDFDVQHLTATLERNYQAHREEVSALHDAYSKVCEATVRYLQNGGSGPHADLCTTLRGAGYEPFPKVLVPDVDGPKDMSSLSDVDVMSDGRD